MNEKARHPVTGDLNKFDTFTDIIARLRGPDGCPWDKEQTHQSLRENLLSESYEVLDALDSGEPDKLCEELGDLLLQIVLQSQIAADSGEFSITCTRGESVSFKISIKNAALKPMSRGSEV